jgi:ABC-type sugar transport system permease subunit
MAALALPGILVLAAFALLPIARLIVLAMEEADGLRPSVFVGPARMLPLLGSAPVMQAIEHSLLCLLVVPFLVAVPLLFAFVTRSGSRGAKLARAFAFLPAVTSTVAVGAVWRLLLDDDSGLLNRWLAGIPTWDGDPIRVAWLTGEGVALVSVLLVTFWRGLGYYAAFFGAALAQASPSLAEAARLDGASALTTFRVATWPSVRGTAALVMTLSAAAAIRLFDEIWVLTSGGPLGRTTTLAWLSWETAFASFPPRLGDAACLALLVAVLSAVALGAARRLGRGRA